MGFKLAASNIGWTAAQDETVWQWMKDLGYSGLEIAPTRLFPDAPYECCNGAAFDLILPKTLPQDPYYVAVQIGRAHV